jgi:hypothetical protein
MKFDLAPYFSFLSKFIINTLLKKTLIIDLIFTNNWYFCKLSK